MMMKIFHFVQVVHGIKLVKMCGEFVTDAFDVLYLTNVSRLQYQSKGTRLEDENHIKGMSFLNLETEEQCLQEYNETLQDLQRKKEVGVLTDLMQKQYENVKKNLGIDDTLLHHQEDISNNIFSQLYPNAPLKLSMLLKSGPKQANSRHIPSDASFKVSSSPFMQDDERQLNGPVRGIHLGMSKITSTAQNSHNSSIIGTLTSRNTIKSRILKLRGDLSTDTNRTGKTLPSLGNIDGSTNVIRGPETKIQISKKENVRSNSQPNLRKALKFYGITPRYCHCRYHLMYY